MVTSGLERIRSYSRYPRKPAPPTMLRGISQSSHESKRRPTPLRRYSGIPWTFCLGISNSDRSILSEASSSRSVLAMTILETFPSGVKPIKMTARNDDYAVYQQ